MCSTRSDFARRQARACSLPPAPSRRILRDMRKTSENEMTSRSGKVYINSINFFFRPGDQGDELVEANRKERVGCWTAWTRDLHWEARLQVCACSESLPYQLTSGGIIRPGDGTR